MQNLPNLITALRLMLTALLAILLMFEQKTGIAFLCCLLFTLAAVTDWVDGYLARRFEAVTTLGKLMDPLADKLLVATALIMLLPLNRLPAWVALVIVSREMMVTGLRGLASSSGIVVAASGLGKVKSTLQYIGLGTLIFPVDLLPIPYLHQIGLAVVYVALVLTLWSGFDYFYKLRQIFLIKEAGKK
ncbi:MAG: CDP-diacylglycerol--glycerol-3-phosphate 3-phosphatidyltransferase [Candidatus Electrothrix sp. AW2]|nr:CDP-diacylglycerol--glycerol-3-phosphate 3-phosphatidyltransferase [Candidatus Electrothrix sp. AX1]MCI5136088.1 CDP-diacylglycerol--glycerol-3-phosphate 3-phosphatidyltransferase [Candidatus Electrothrix gigas]MCI5193525.1 CDP-diacylglycerol--glycerol-3-phosphate 3-phosphatidyltransferase [Candidatus Electrothrix gigas]